MIRLLFVFDDCPSGQVASLLAARMRGMLKDGAAAAEFAFPRERGARSLLLPHGPVHLEPDPRRLRKLAEARGYDAVIAIDCESYLEALAQETSAPLPVIVELRRASDGMLERLDRHALRGVLVPSARQKTRVLDRLHGELRTRVVEVRDSADASMFSPAAASEAHARPILLFRGELEERDGWSTFLEIGALVAIRAPELELWMLGGEDAPEEIALAMLETAESLGVLRRLRWFPELEHSAVAKIHAYAGKSGGALIAARKNETSGQAVLEALLAGCPVIAALPTAASELVAGHEKYLMTFGEERYDEAEQAVFGLLQDASGRVRRALLDDRERLAHRADPLSTGASYLAAIKKLLGKE